MKYLLTVVGCIQIALGAMIIISHLGRGAVGPNLIGGLILGGAGLLAMQVKNQGKGHSLLYVVNGILLLLFCSSIWLLIKQGAPAGILVILGFFVAVSASAVFATAQIPRQT